MTGIDPIREEMSVRPGFTKIAASLFVFVLFLTSCAQDTDEKPRTEAQGKKMSLAESCKTNVAINKGFNKAFADIEEPEGPPSAETTKKIQEGLDQHVMRHVRKLAAAPPEEVKGEVKIAAEAVEDLRKDPGKDPFEDPKVNEAVQKIDGYYYENCDFDKHSVSGTEYQFADVPENLSVEDVSFRLENKGKELHEFIVMTKKEGVTETFDQILALGEEESQSKIHYVGGVGPTEPGDKGYAVVSFEKPGDYLAVCFLPRGVTSMEELQSEGGPEGGASPGASPSPGATGSPGAAASPSPGGGGDEPPPHFTLGMKKEFKVV